MIVAHKIALDLNNKQRSYMVRASGCARFAYNWALKEWQQQYEAWKKDNNLQSLMTMRYVDNSIL